MDKIQRKMKRCATDNLTTCIGLLAFFAFVSVEIDIFTLSILPV